MNAASVQHTICTVCLRTANTWICVSIQHQHQFLHHSNNLIFLNKKTQQRFEK